MNPTTAFLGRPIRSLQTMLRLIAAVNPEISSVIPDGVYGKSTMRSVSSLQRYARLPTTGVVDLATWNEIIAMYYDAVEELLLPQALEIYLQPGQRIVPGEENQHIYLVQAMFRSIGSLVEEVPTVELNGRNDEATTQALIWLQEHSDLPATGELDRRTWRYLVGLYRVTAFDGKASLNRI